MDRPARCVGKTRGFFLNPGSNFVGHGQFIVSMGLDVG